MARSLDAAANAARAQRAFTPTNVSALKSAQQATVGALASATQEFARQHNIRDDILAKHRANLKAELAQQAVLTKQAQGELKKFEESERRLQRSLANQQAAIDRGVTNKRSLGGFQGAVTRDKNDLAASKRAIEDLERQAIESNNRITKSGQDAAAALSASHAAERRAIADVNEALTKQNTLRRSIAKDAGVPALSRFADDAERASTRYIRASQAMLTVQDQLDDVRRRMAQTINPAALQSLADREEQLLQRRARLADISKAQFAALETAEAGFTTRMSAEVDKRIAIAEREAAAVRAAQAERARLARQQVIAKGVDVAVKGAIALGAAIGVSTAAFVQFEQKMLQVQSVSQDTDQEMARMTERVRELAIELGQSPVDLAEGLYTIAQAGFQGEQALGILEQAARAAVAGLTDVETAARPLIAVMSAYGDAAGSAKDISDVLFEAVTAGVFSFEDLASQIGDNVPLAAQMEVSIQELAAAYVVLTKQGNSLSESTTQVNGILRAFLKPTEALQKVIQAAGFETGALAVEQLGLAGAMELALRAADGNNDALADMFPLIRGLRGVVALSVNDWEDYDKALTQVTGASEGVGRTQETLAKQMESTAFQLRVAREEIRGAAISLGGEFAPAVVNLAQTLGSAAQAIARFNDETGGMAANIITFGFAASVAFVGVAKLVGGIMGAVKTFKELKIAIEGSARAMTLLRLSPIILALSGIAAVTALAISRHRDHKQAVKDLEDAITSLRDRVEQLKLAFASLAEINAQEKLVKNVEATVDALDKQKKAVEEAISVAETEFNVFEGQEKIDAGERFQALREELEQLQGAERDVADATAIMEDALAQPNVDTLELIKTFDTLLFFLRTGQIDLETFTAAVKAVRENIGDYADETKKAADSTEDLDSEMEQVPETMLTVAEFFEQATSNSEDFRKSVADTIKAARDLAGISTSVDDPFGFVSAVKGLKSANIFDQLLKLTKRRETDLVNLSPDTAEAFKLADQLTRVVAKINELDAAFQQNADDISMWQGRIDLLNDVLGENTDTLSEYERQLAAGEITQEEFNEAVGSGEAHVAMAELQRLLDEGKISQSEYNKIKEAAIFLHERSAGALEDERVEQAKLIPALADYVKQRDSLNAQIGELDPNTQARIAALQSEAGQMAINTAIMLKMLETMGLIPEGVATQFIADMSAYDPVIGALFDDIGFIKDENPVEIDIRTMEETRDTRERLAEIQRQIDALNQENIDLSDGGLNNHELERRLEILREIEGLSKEKLSLELLLDTGRSINDVQKLTDLIQDIDRAEGGGFTISVDTEEAAAEIREFLGIEVGDKRFRIVIDGIETSADLDRELQRRIRRSATAAGFTGFDNDGFVATWRAKITAEDTNAAERLSEIRFLIQAITGDPAQVTVGVQTQAARTAILAITGFIDQTLLTDDFVAYLDANGDGVLDETELAKLAVQGFEGTYTAYLVAEAEQAKGELKEVDGVKVEVLEDGTMHITAETSEELDKFLELNGTELEGATFPIKIEMNTTVEEGTAAFDPGAKFREGGDSALPPIKVGVEVDTTQAETELTTFTGTTLPTAQTNANTASLLIGQAVRDGVAVGMSGVVADTDVTMGNVVTTMDKSGSTYDIGFNTGSNLGLGIAAGIDSTLGAIAAAAERAVAAANTAANSKAQTASPSKLFAKLGRNLILGAALGVENTTGVLVSAIQRTMDGAFTSFDPRTSLSSMSGGSPVVSPAVIASAQGGGETYNISMDVTVPAANFKEWIGTVEFVQEVKRGFGTTLAGSRSR